MKFHVPTKESREFEGEKKERREASRWSLSLSLFLSLVFLIIHFTASPAPRRRAWMVTTDSRSPRAGMIWPQLEIDDGKSTRADCSRRTRSPPGPAQWTRRSRRANSWCTVSREQGGKNGRARWGLGGDRLQSGRRLSARPWVKVCGSERLKSIMAGVATNLEGTVRRRGSRLLCPTILLSLSSLLTALFTRGLIIMFRIVPRQIYRKMFEIMELSKMLRLLRVKWALTISMYACPQMAIQPGSWARQIARSINKRFQMAQFSSRPPLRGWTSHIHHPCRLWACGNGQVERCLQSVQSHGVQPSFLKVFLSISFYTMLCCQPAHEPRILLLCLCWERSWCNVTSCQNFDLPITPIFSGLLPTSEGKQNGLVFITEEF